MAYQKCSPLALGYSLAIISAVYMLVLSILGLAGTAAGTVAWMQSMHIFYSLSAVGIIAGIVEGAIHGFVLGFVISWLYNLFVK